MTNVHPFPKSPKDNTVKPHRKDPGPAGGGGPAFRLRDHNGDLVDVLMMIIQVGGLYLNPRLIALMTTCRRPTCCAPWMASMQ